MFHRQSVCGLILGLTLVLLAGVFRPAEGVPPLKETGATVATIESSSNSSGIDSARATPEKDEGDAPGQTTGRTATEAPGKLP